METRITVKNEKIKTTWEINSSLKSHKNFSLKNLSLSVRNLNCRLRMAGLIKKQQAVYV